MILKLPIDVKSLYFNIKNDNKSGHTATVATPLLQYGTWHEELANILKIPENINRISKENIIDLILSKSRAEAKINKVFVFDKISVNGHLLENLPSYGLYIREETSPENVHCGRQKVHYPTTFKYSDEDICINNRAVINAISEFLHNYAFIVEAFEYDTDTRVLNFDTVIVGPNGIPYSKVFINKKGTGNKFALIFNEDADSYDAEIIALREKFGYDNVTPSNFSDYMNENKKAALEIAKNYILSHNGSQIRYLNEDYPYSLYDMEYNANDIKHFVIIRYSSTSIKYFNLSANKIKFCHAFSENTVVLLINTINTNPVISVYTIEQLNNMKKSINSINYEDTGACDE